MNSPELNLLRIMLLGRLQHARRSERGASAVEWVVITAILVAIVVLVGGILTQKIQGKADSINLD